MLRALINKVLRAINIDVKSIVISLLMNLFHWICSVKRFLTTGNFLKETLTVIQFKDKETKKVAYLTLCAK